MAGIDMTLEELKKYKGTNPKPADYDDYWEAAIKEMNSVDPNVEIAQAKFRANNSECYDMYFTGVKGARIHTKYLKPKKAGAKLPTVLLFHGYSSCSEDFSALLKWSGEGYAVFAMDCRGQGGKSEDVGGTKGNTTNGQLLRGLTDASPGNLLFRHILLDAIQLANIAATFDFVDKERMYAAGGSQGGALSVACAAFSGRIKKVAVLYTFLSDYKRVWDMNLAQGAYADITHYFRETDPRHETEEQVFERLGYIDIQFMAPKVTAETLMFVGLMDNICPPSTQFSVYNKLEAHKKMIIYPDYGHEDFPESYDIIMEFFNDGQ